MKRPAWILALVAALFALACAGAPDSPGTDTAPSVVKTDKFVTSWGDGDYRVGREIPAGEYQTVADGVIVCGWSRVKSFDGQLGSIIANGLVNDGAKARLLVKKSDYGVSLSGGCNWTAVKK